jgi:predicted ArsR family transcriptional regulator
MTSPLPRPDRQRPPAGSGHPFDQVGDAEEPLVAMAPDMERALGALRDFTRRDILLRFYTDHKPRSVEDVARAAGVHRSVAFDHLERLAALGYLEVERRGGLPGRPAKIYRLHAGPVQISHPMRRYDILAEGLARAVSSEPGGTQMIRAAGRALGDRLAPPHLTSLAASLEPLIEMGGVYELGRAGRIVCTNCLFHEVCRREPSVCEFHAGAIEGLSGRSVERPSIRSLGFLAPSGCAYQIED